MESTNWKLKSIQRGAKIKELKKRLKEMTISRDGWKQKSIEHKLRADTAVKIQKKTRELIQKIVV